MPRKPCTLLVMQDYPPLSPRRWHPLIVQAVRKISRAAVRLEMGVADDEHQAGRTIIHELPAVLTPNSPLSRFLADAFNVHLSENQPFDLAALVGRRLQARFDKGVDGRFQAMVDVRSCKEATAQTKEVNKVSPKQEENDGLG